MSNGSKKAQAEFLRNKPLSVNQLLIDSMRGGQVIKRAADTSDVDTRMMQERLRLNRDALEAREEEAFEAPQPPDDFQQRFDALYEKRRRENLTARQKPPPPQKPSARQAPALKAPALRARQEPTTVRPPPKPQGNKFSPKIPVGKKGATLQPTTGGKGVGGGVKATVKFK